LAFKNIFDAMISDIKEETVKSVLSFYTNQVKSSSSSYDDDDDDDFSDIAPFFDQLSSKISESENASVGY